ncbi:MAG: hypothetical protein M4579_005393 [Chaenotheca gracillima]|nr:MAG: hypothetical protein M4579_005393 [Chaenotheca gracillima]
MMRPETPPLLDKIKNPSSLAEHVQALRALKNEIIGHEQKKQLWIELGVLTPLLRTLSNPKTEGKRLSRDVNGSVNTKWDSSSLGDEEQARLQATIIIGSLAHESSIFASSILRTSGLSSMVSGLSPGQMQPQLVLATLRALNAIADALSLSSSRPGIPDPIFSNLLCSNECAPNWVRILSQSSTASTVQQQISLAASLIAKTSREERHHVALTNGGVLDALATRLASFVVSKGFVLPGADQIAQNEGRSANFPSPAPASAQLYPILEALSVLIHDSVFRAARLLYSPAIVAVFPSIQGNSLPEWYGSPPGQLHPPLSRTSEQGHLNAIDYLLPPIPSPSKPPLASNLAFPPLGTPVSKSKASRRPSWPQDVLEMNIDSQSAAADSIEEDESPLVAWLFCIAREEDGLIRLTAASILTVLYKAGLTHKRRESSLALLIVPLLVRMFDDERSSAEMSSTSLSKDVPETSRESKERAPAVLAMLVTDSIDLQKAAVDAHAIKKLSQMLKIAFDPIPENTQGSTWSPFEKHTPSPGDSADSVEVDKGRSQEAQTPVVAIHKLKVRESALKALAALCPFKDEYRKMIIDTGVTPFVVESLRPTGSNNQSAHANGGGDETKTNGSHSSSRSFGNPASVIIAACGAVRALSRSVSILRTSLIDAGVAMPVFELLKNADVEVQIAATAAVCNLVVEFSPMREPIMRAGGLKILCQHTHSTNQRLRLNGLWALKHLVFTAENDAKIQCFEELGQGWLVQLICDDAEVAALTSLVLKRDGELMMEAPPRASGNVVESNGSEAHSSQMVMQDEEDTKMSDSDFRPTTQDGSRILGARDPLIDKLSVLREAEANLATKARRDDGAVQEQGLDFIRNIICGQSSEPVIDFLFAALGQDKLFNILAMKLRPSLANLTSQDRRLSQGLERPSVQPISGIIISACFILVHIAAGHPRHRQILVSQTELLKLLFPYFVHSSGQVRVAAVWVLINLTWYDSNDDEPASKARALELKRLGFYTQLESMEQDPELDVRERTKTALFQFRRLL